MGAFGRRVVTFVASSLVTGCALVLGFEDLKEGSTTTAGEAGAADGSSDGAPILDGSASEGSAPGCPAGRGPSMVRIDLPEASFCIDSTEVTRAQYKAFLDDSTKMRVQPPSCAWNDKLIEQPAMVDFKLQNNPMIFVDWCDAFAFCAWAGKRLCGALGDGGALPIDAPIKSREWSAACTHAGNRSYPYGDVHNASACHVGAFDAGSVEVGSFKGCEGGFKGIFDMVGNVTEWENACDLTPGGDGTCANRGSSYRSSFDVCDYASPDIAKDVAGDWGIRCCASVK